MSSTPKANGFWNFRKMDKYLKTIIYQNLLKNLFLILKYLITILKFESSGYNLHAKETLNQDFYRWVLQNFQEIIQVLHTFR